MLQRNIVIFLVKFIGLYLALNTLYAIWIRSYVPDVDVVTSFVTEQTGVILSVFEENISVSVTDDKVYVPIKQTGRTVVNVYEGCNGLNVMIVFIAFVVAFAKKWKPTVVFILMGLVCIYLINLGRVTSLFLIAKYFPDSLYFFHKYLFTGLLYLFVFFLWFVWIKRIQVKSSEGN